jgi:hypothetical protein
MERKAVLTRSYNRRILQPFLAYLATFLGEGQGNRKVDLEVVKADDDHIRYMSATRIWKPGSSKSGLVTK